jgi:hypothetical protein
MGWVVNATSRPLDLQERPGKHCVGGWVGLKAGLDRRGKSRPTGIRSPDRPARGESLYRLGFLGSRFANQTKIKYRVNHYIQDKSDILVIYRVRINYRSILQNHIFTISLMTDAFSVTKLFILPSNRRLRRTTTSKLPSERALNHHKIQGHTKYARSVRQPFPSNTGLRFSREMAVATIGPFQLLRSLCVIDTNFKILRQTSFSTYGVTKYSDNL